METKSFCEIQGANSQATSVGGLPRGVSWKMMKCSHVPKPILAEEETVWEERLKVPVSFKLDTRPVWKVSGLAGHAVYLLPFLCHLSPVSSC